MCDTVREVDTCSVSTVGLGALIAQTRRDVTVLGFSALYQRIWRTSGSVYPEYGDMFLQKVGTYLPNYTASHHKRLK